MSKPRSKSKQPNLEEDPDKTAYNCAICTRPDHEDTHMVCCDHCQKWYHIGCVGATEAVEKEDEWICPECRGSGTAAEEVDPDREDEEIAAAMKALEQQREKLKKNQAQKLKLAQMQLDLERERSEMRWDTEKKILEMKIKAETDFNNKRESERQKLQQELKQLVGKRSQEEKERKKSSKKSDAVGKKEDMVNPKAFCDNNVNHSTPIPLAGPSGLSIGKKHPKHGGALTPAKAQTGDSSTSESESNNSSRSETESDEEETERKGKRDIARIGPTKAQLTARQFLSRKLPTFTGRPEEWPMFFSSYHTSTEACGFSNLENLARLQECLRGAARDAVCSRLLSPDAVPQVMETLRMLYGRPEQLLDTLLAKVRKADPPKSDKLTSFITFGVLVQQLCDHLEASKLEDHVKNPMLIRELVEKLPATTKIDWVRYKRQTATVTLRTLADFLSDLVSAASEVVDYSDTSAQIRGGKMGKAKNATNKEQESYVYTHGGFDGTGEINKQGRTPCVMCGQTNHRLRNCENFRKLSVPQRKKAVDKWELCQICLNAHGKAKCKLNIRCTVGDCSERHNSLLHPAEAQSNCNTHNVFNKNSILFRMVPVRIFNGDKSVTIVAFLDEGSSYSLVDSSLARKLQCNGTTQPLRISWTAGVSRLEKDSQRLRLTIAACGSNEKFILRDVYTVNNLKLPAQSMSFADVAGKYRHLEGLPVADYAPSPPMLLIGLKHIEIFAPLESRIGQPGEPIAVRSKLGWSIYGPQGSITGEGFVGQHSCAGLSNEELHDLLKSQYALEEKGISVEMLPESEEDRRARDILEERTVRVGDGFMTGLLFKEENPTFPDSLPMALRRMKSLEKKLSTNPQLEVAVKQQIVQYLEKGYCHKATKEELNSADPEKCWYLPLNVVVNPKKNKVRLVWDAAAEVNGVSLNSKLMKGPDYLTSLPSVIVKCREHLVGFGGDIREMFHQLKIRPEDRQAQMFVYQNEIYVMDCAIFGASCSPSMALYVKDKNARDFADQFPEAYEAIVHKHYVDDYFDSTDTVEKAVQRASEVRFVHSKGGFEIKSWVSNSPIFLERMGETENKEAIHIDSANPERVLGIVWDTRDDVFTFTTKMRDSLLPYLYDEQVPTKRVVLSCVMSLFDPLGLLAPFTFYAKALIQILWRMGCEWDQVIEGEALENWKLWTGHLADVEAVQIPRYYFGDGLSLDYSTLQLHIFADASEKAYGCVGYFRILAGGIPRCALVQAKSKVAPIKQVSIPRMELMAAVLGCRLADTIKENHSLTVTQVFYWTDSRTVQSWIVSDQRKYKPFVAFRIGEIISRSQPSEWRWLPTKLNVADQLTKWNKGPQLVSWFRGPQFLYGPESEWPQHRSTKPNVEEEMRTAFLLHDIEVQAQLVDVSRFSKWNVLVRTLACVKRFIDNTDQEARKGYRNSSSINERQSVGHDEVADDRETIDP
ncbi:uncharacterized protein LOC128745607 [Sabethes cyaneus]|uniref:uncharacterized protein LOC128745607 n=1 Tax=Sabethes cyaneus TaxID=53552 RepID=UPI00237E1AD8|nr:uncharacterized protein LOC128745607 [Sabethes cyaneus]